ncbi:MAG: hypothetical protein ACOCUV_02170, partial [bacterium]
SLYVKTTGKTDPTFLEVEEYMFSRAISLADKLLDDQTILQYYERSDQELFSNLAGLTYTKSESAYPEREHRPEKQYVLALTDLGKRVVKKKSTKIRDDVNTMLLGKK